MEREQHLIPIKPEQAKRVLKFIDATQSEAIKREIFNQLGHECYQCSSLPDWLEQFVGNPQTLLDRVNIEQKSRDWESLVFSEDNTTLTLTGRKIPGCPCGYAEGSEPPLSLCHYCCKAFQETFFKALFGREVEVEITEALLLGGERCSTIIHFV